MCKDVYRRSLKCFLGHDMSECPLSKKSEVEKLSGIPTKMLKTFNREVSGKDKKVMKITATTVVKVMRRMIPNSRTTLQQKTSSKYKNV